MKSYRYRPVAERGHQPPGEANQNNRERPDHNIGEPVSANHNARKRENHKYNKGDNPRRFAEITQHKGGKYQQHHTVIAWETVF